MENGARAAGPVPKHGPLTRVLSAVAAIAILIASVLAYFHVREQPATRLATARLHMALPVGAAPDLNFQISPDGRRLAYLGRGPTAFSASTCAPWTGWTRARSSVRRMPGAAPCSGRLTAVGSRSRAKGRLKKIDMSGGGSPQTIADVTGAGVIGGAWNRDGVMVFGSNAVGRPGSGGLFKVSADGGSITPITVIDVSRQELGHRFPTFLPDGRRFLYLRTSYDPEQSGIFVGNIDSAPDAQSLARVTATPAGHAVFVSSDNARSSAAGGWLLFLRANALFAQPFNLQTLQLTGEPREVAEAVGTLLDRGLFSASPTTLLYTTAAGALDMQLRWYDASGGPPATPWVPLAPTPTSASRPMARGRSSPPASSIAAHGVRCG